MTLSKSLKVSLMDPVNTAFVREELEAKRQKIRVLFGKADYMAAKTVEVRGHCV